MKFLIKLMENIIHLNFIEKILKKIDQLILSEEFKFLTASFNETINENKINLKIFLKILINHL